jgi:hypothetical protein
MACSILADNVFFKKKKNKRKYLKQTVLNWWCVDRIHQKQQSY